MNFSYLRVFILDMPYTEKHEDFYPASWYNNTHVFDRCPTCSSLCQVTICFRNLSVRCNLLQPGQRRDSKTNYSTRREEFLLVFLHT
jgi:hypothetical protein